ncbi:mucin-2-like [Haliotis rufescens]|uniref:mucin-2-like n=1 Tax=Haliotis rufescens TaxID=6454 RepID=UPI00201F7A96|nr:mucin-2-like [Haliotis rufescens]
MLAYAASLMTTVMLAGAVLTEGARSVPGLAVAPAHVVSSWTVAARDRCYKLCLYTPNCVSVNWRWKTTPAVCELNKVTETDSPEAVTPDDETVYIELSAEEQSGRVRMCQPPEMHVPVRGHQGYLCLRLGLTAEDTVTEGSSVPTTTRGEEGTVPPSVSTTTRGEEGTVPPSVSTTTRGEEGTVPPSVSTTTRGEEGTVPPSVSTTTREEEGTVPPLVSTTTREEGTVPPFVSTTTRGEEGTVPPSVSTTTREEEGTVPPFVSTTTREEEGTVRPFVSTTTRGEEGTVPPFVSTTTREEEGTVPPFVSTTTREEEGTVPPFVSTTTRGEEGTVPPFELEVEGIPGQAWSSIFKRYDHYYLTGHNKQILIGMTVEQCLQTCLNETTYLCRSVDYWKEKRGNPTCQLSDVTKDEAPDSWTNKDEAAFHFERI